jgi:hypothetical protein
LAQDLRAVLRLACIGIPCYIARDAIIVAKQAEHGCPKMGYRHVAEVKEPSDAAIKASV